jgi:DNA-binding MarR family transcriptional regulator
VAILHLIEVCQRRGERASTTWLSERLKLAKPSISQALNAMEEKGWIHRSIDPDNRRQTNIDVTEEGQRKMAQAYRMVVASVTRVLDHMGRENAERFVELMEQFLDGAKVEFQRKE